VGRHKKRRRKDHFPPANPSSMQQQQQISSQQQTSPTVTHRQTFAHWEGPLPPPGALQQFNEVIPNGAERVMVLCEKQSSHRQELERKVIDSRIANMKRGQIFALLVAVLTLLVAGCCAYIGQPVVALAIVGIDLVSLATVFIYGSHAQRKELKERREAK